MTPHELKPLRRALRQAEAAEQRLRDAHREAMRTSRQLRAMVARSETAAEVTMPVPESPGDFVPLSVAVDRWAVSKSTALKRATRAFERDRGALKIGGRWLISPSELTRWPLRSSAHRA